MAKIKPILYSRKDSNGRNPIKVRITVGINSKFVPMGFGLRPSDWNKKEGRVRTSVPDHEVLNKKIKAYISQLEAVVERLNGVELSPDLILRALQNSSTKTAEGLDFFAYAKLQMKRLEDSRQFRTANRRQTLLKKVESFWGTPSLPFSEITVTFLKDFEAFLIGSIGNAKTTCAKEIAIMRKILNDAVAEDRMEASQNPFLQFKVSQARTVKERLTGEELRALFALELDPSSTSFHVLNMFKFQFYTGGTRIGDCLQLRWKNVSHDRLQFSMEKTTKSRSVLLLDPCKHILDQYKKGKPKPDSFIFPFLDERIDLSNLKLLQKQVEAKTALINKYLKQLAKKAGIEKKISTHTARHSMADYLRKSGQSVYDISKILGHSSIKITEGYMASLDQGSADETLSVLKEI